MLRTAKDIQAFTEHKCKTFYVTLVKLDDAFKDRLIAVYKNDLYQSEILRLTTLEEERQGRDKNYYIDLNPNGTYVLLLGLKFFKFDGLLYYADDKEGRERLYIPRELEKEVFKIAYDGHYY